MLQRFGPAERLGMDEASLALAALEPAGHLPNEHWKRGVVCVGACVGPHLGMPVNGGVRRKQGRSRCDLPVLPVLDARYTRGFVAPNTARKPA